MSEGERGEQLSFSDEDLGISSEDKKSEESNHNEGGGNGGGGNGGNGTRRTKLRPEDVWRTDQEEMMKSLEDIGFSRRDILEFYDGDPFNYPEGAVDEKEPSEKLDLDKMEAEEERRINEEKEKKLYGMTKREALENPENFLETIESMLKELEESADIVKKEYHEKKMGRLPKTIDASDPNKKLRFKKFTDLTRLFILAGSLKYELKKAGLEERIEELKERMRKLWEEERKYSH